MGTKKTCTKFACAFLGEKAYRVSFLLTIIPWEVDDPNIVWGPTTRMKKVADLMSYSRVSRQLSRDDIPETPIGNLTHLCQGIVCPLWRKKSCLPKKSQGFIGVGCRGDIVPKSWREVITVARNVIKVSIGQ